MPYIDLNPPVYSPGDLERFAEEEGITVEDVTVPGRTYRFRYTSDFGALRRMLETFFDPSESPEEPNDDLLYDLHLVRELDEEALQEVSRLAKARIVDVLKDADDEVPHRYIMVNVQHKKFLRLVDDGGWYLFDYWFKRSTDGHFDLLMSSTQERYL